MNGEPSSSDASAIPWRTLVAAALAAAVGFLVAFAVARAASGGDDARTADRVRPLDAPGGQVRVRNLERAGGIPELRLTSGSGARRARAQRASGAQEDRPSGSAARSTPRRSGGGRPARPAPPEEPATAPGGPPPPTDGGDPPPGGGASDGP